MFTYLSNLLLILVRKLSILFFSSFVMFDFNLASSTSAIILNLLLTSKLTSTSPLSFVSLSTTYLNDKFFLLVNFSFFFTLEYFVEYIKSIFSLLSLNV